MGRKCRVISAEQHGEPSYNKGNLDDVDAVVGPDWVRHGIDGTPRSRQRVRGRPALATSAGRIGSGHGEGGAVGIRPSPSRGFAREVGSEGANRQRCQWLDQAADLVVAVVGRPALERFRSPRARAASDHSSPPLSRSTDRETTRAISTTSMLGLGARRDRDSACAGGRRSRPVPGASAPDMAKGAPSASDPRRHGASLARSGARALTDRGVNGSITLAASPTDLLPAGKLSIAVSWQGVQSNANFSSNCHNRLLHGSRSRCVARLLPRNRSN